MNVIKLFIIYSTDLLNIANFFFKRFIFRGIKFFNKDYLVQNKRVLWEEFLDLNNFFFFDSFRCRSLGGSFRESIGLVSYKSFVINFNRNVSEINLSFFFKNKISNKIIGTIDIYSGKKKISILKDLTQGEWHQVSLPNKDKKSIQIFNNTNQSCFISKSLLNYNKSKKSKNLINNIILLVLDSVDTKTVNETKSLNLIPNINNFFKKKIIFNNCISTSEWTFPWVHSFFSGQYPSKHRLTDTRQKIDNGINYKKNIIDYLKKNNFYTTGFGTKTLYNNWWGNVNFFDNFYFTNGGYEKNINILTASKKVIEILSTSNKNNFFLMHMMDTHYPFPQRSISEQYKLGNFRNCSPYRLWTNVEYFNDTKAEAIYSEPAKKELKRYVQSRINEVDRDLSYLFNFLNKGSFLKNTAVILTSDHGYAYQDSPRHLLNFQRTNVPLMIRHPYLKNKKYNNLVNNSTDVNNIVKLISDQKKLQLDDFREYAISESLYGLRYKASIRNKNYSYHINCVYSSENNTIDLATPIYEKIYNSNDTKEIILKRANLLQKFKKILFKHIFRNFNGKILR